MADQRRIRARYAVKALGKQKVHYTKCSMNPETNSLEQEPAVKETECWMVHFPQGHSIRVTSFEELKRMGFDKKPKMVDMDTGEVVDFGGDAYDFANNPHEQFETVVENFEEEESSKKVKEKV